MQIHASVSQDLLPGFGAGIAGGILVVLETLEPLRSLQFSILAVNKMTTENQVLVVLRVENFFSHCSKRL